jgi:5'-nucleotidase/UDP-sugar diphosphatase
METMTMKYAALSLASLAAASMAVGCANNNKKAAAPVNSGVTDVRPITPAPAPVMVQPVQPIQPVQPVVSDTPPVVQAAPAPAVASATPAITSSTYTVQKGDTLYKIARAKYGDASAVKKIQAANPGLNANGIKAGQKINLP